MIQFHPCDGFRVQISLFYSVICNGFLHMPHAGCESIENNVGIISYHIMYIEVYVDEI